jgi:hypothetical protein
MAKNPKWWKDTEAPADEASAEEEDDVKLPGDGEPVTADLTHAQLDEVALDRLIELPEGLNKADKVAYINDPANQVV